MYVSLLRVMATMARITTTSSAAAMITAAVGLSPKMVVRSEVTVRGSAEPSSLLAGELSLRVSVRVVERSVVVAGLELLELLEAPGDFTEPLDEVDGVETEPLADPDGGVETEPLADPDGVDTEPLAEPLGLVLVWAKAPPTSPNVTVAMSRRTATRFMLHLLPGPGATPVPPEALATLTRSGR
jgi:hypothetical protein